LKHRPQTHTRGEERDMGRKEHSVEAKLTLPNDGKGALFWSTKVASVARVGVGGIA
jgi:hypothetical protein